MTAVLTTFDLPLLHVPADARHGVTLYAARLAEALGASTIATPAAIGQAAPTLGTPLGDANAGFGPPSGEASTVFGPPSEASSVVGTSLGDPNAILGTSLGEPSAVLGTPLGEAGGRMPVHVHFTDRQWGADPASAAAAFERLAGRCSLTVTLHDLPQPSDGARSLERRSSSYRRVVRAAAGVVCNSHHEAALLALHVDPSVAPTVIPLPVDREPSSLLPPLPPASAAEGARTTASVSVLGYVYPGKGHDRVIRAVGRIAGVGRRPRPVVEALGRASHGHERDLESVRRIARHEGVGLVVTGFLPDAVMLERSRLADVPVIAHQHVSASGSLATWLGAGRRPVVLRSPYMEEMAELHRGALTLVDARDLPGALDHALAHPESTWLGPDARLGPSLAGVAALYRDFWATVPR
jgi:glycosyltransferase involved in cell wall biosynthesis